MISDSNNPAGPDLSRREVSVVRFLFELPGLLSWRFAGLVALTLLVGLVTGAALVMLIPMLQVVGMEVTEGTAATLVDTIFSLLTAVGIQPNLETILILNVLVAAGAAGLIYLQAIVTERFRQAQVRSMRERLFENLGRAEWLYLTGERGSDFSHLLLAEVERIGAAIHSLLSLLSGGGRAVVYIVIALLLSPAVTAGTVLFGSLLALLLFRQTSLARARGKDVSAAYQALYSATDENLAALKLIKSHALEDDRARCYAQASRAVEAANVAVIRNHAGVGFWLQASTALGLSIIVFLALGVVGLELATVLLLLYLFSRLLPMVTGLQRNYQTLINLLPAFARYRAAALQSADARETASERPNGFALREGIRLRGVSFEFPTQAEPGLRSVDLYLPANRTTALVGPSGAGKSTIADLLIGLLPPRSGEVLIDGEPLEPDRRRAWRRQIAYVSQDAFLLHATVRENLLLSRADASEQELWEALEMAAATFVASLPAGLDTVVGDRGVRLSGGERQRLVLARALLRKPELLVLDEATSSLDAANEERIREAIDGLAGKMTILLIAHRLASIRSSHTIHVVESGRVVESGSWTELMRVPQGRFRSLAQAQGLVEPLDPPSALLPVPPLS